jgi:hypothetical protein
MTRLPRLGQPPRRDPAGRTPIVKTDDLAGGTTQLEGALAGAGRSRMTEGQRGYKSGYTSGLRRHCKAPEPRDFIRFSGFSEKLYAENRRVQR